MFCHGFVNAADGRKMSKSYNNAVDPNDVSGAANANNKKQRYESSICLGHAQCRLISFTLYVVAGQVLDRYNPLLHDGQRHIRRGPQLLRAIACVDAQLGTGRHVGQPGPPRSQLMSEVLRRKSSFQRARFRLCTSLVCGGVAVGTYPRHAHL